MATYVLVGGAWLGGWAWRDVARRLRAGGHEVYPATLTGLGERVHLARPETDLETHVADVVNLIGAEDLDGVVLVGHSYSGIVVTGVADRVGARLANLVFVDSAPFEDGESFLSFQPPEAGDHLRRQVDEVGDGWRLPFPTWDELGEQSSLTGLGPGARELMRARAAPQPFRTYTAPLQLTGGAGSYGRTIVACEDFRALLGAGIPRLDALNGPGWRRLDLETGHWPMLSAPEELAAALGTVVADG